MTPGRKNTILSRSYKQLNGLRTLSGLFELTRHPSKDTRPQPLVMSCFWNPVPELSAINPTAILEKLYPHCLRYTRTPSRVLLSVEVP